MRGVWREAITGFIEEEVVKAWLAESAMSASEWEARRERVVVIHERCDPQERVEELAWAMVEGRVPEDDCDAVDRALEEARTRLEPIFEGRSVRDAVARAQALLPEKRRYERIAGMQEPWPVDLYLLPHQPEPV